MALIARIAAQADWRSVFLIGVGRTAGAVGAYAVWRCLPETRPLPRPDAVRGSIRALFGESRSIQTLLLWLALTR